MKRFRVRFRERWVSLVAPLVKNPPPVRETLVPFLGREDPLEKIGYPLHCSWASLVAQLVKNLPAMQETWVRSLGWEDPLDSPRSHGESDTTERLSVSLFTLGWGGFPGSSAVKNPPAMQELQETRIWSLIWEETLVENMATQYSCLENPMDRGAWWVTVHRVTKSQPQLKHLSTQKTPRIKIVILLCNILKSQNQCKNSWWTKYQHCNIRQEQYYRYFLYLRLHYGSVWHWLECNDNKLENEVFFWRKWTSISPSLLGACWKGITVQS